MEYGKTRSVRKHSKTQHSEILVHIPWNVVCEIPFKVGIRAEINALAIVNIS